ncbi:MAG: lysine 2,3-aminomutase [Gemmatimonadota bacterium]|nr:lysine 2,3-aminomutase [Gemmatimonadota bacterium]
MTLYSVRDLETLPPLQRFTAAERSAMRVVAHVLPFRANDYVVDELIDWDRAPDDPIFRLTFPWPDMLEPEDFRRMEAALASGDAERVRGAATEIRRRLNPHPAGQSDANVPRLDGEPVPGLQHKYRETVLVFPAAGQTCHAWCTYCFRWPQFVRSEAKRFATARARPDLEYVRRHREVTDVLLTGGDPLIMKTARLAAFVEPLLQPGFEHVRTIRIGTKAPAYWPYRFLSDDDADDVLRLFERVVESGRHLAFMAHFSHPRELSTPAARSALRRVRGAGAVIRTQAPIVRHVNDDAGTWARMWSEQVRLGCVPYYMFVERDTGAHAYFAVPLARALEIYGAAFRSVSGLGRTARGPVMSAWPGKVLVEGTADVAGRRVFVLRLLQARDPEQAGRVLFARYDPRATWLTDLVPAFGDVRPGDAAVTGRTAPGHPPALWRHLARPRSAAPRDGSRSTRKPT